MDWTVRTLNNIQLSETDRAAVSKAADLLRERFPVEQVILFGSKARGRDDPESDIDLLVLTSRPLPWSEQAEMIWAMSPVQHKHDVIISLVVAASREWNEGVYQVLPIRREVDRDGVIL